MQSQIDWNISAYNFWRQNFKPSLEAIGCNVFEPDGLDLAEPLARTYDKTWVKRDKHVMGEELFNLVKKTHKKFGLDLFFSYFYSTHVEPEILESIQDLGIPVVNFYCDNVRDFDSVKAIVNSVTLNWLPEYDAIKYYKDLDAPFIYQPMGVNTDLYQKVTGKELDQVSFAGSCDYLRMLLLKPVIDTDINLKIYGAGWSENNSVKTDIKNKHESYQISGITKRILSAKQHINRVLKYGFKSEYRYFSSRNIKRELSAYFSEAVSFLDQDEFFRVLGRSKITLGINRCPHPGYSLKKPLVYSRLRDIEAPCLGACYLTEDCSDVRNIYDVGEEVLTYKDSDELIEKIKYMSQNDDLRSKLRKNGRKAVMERHSLTKRFEKIFEIIG